MSRITNLEQLAHSKLRKQSLLIAEAGLEAINTVQAVRKLVSFNERTNSLKVVNNVFDLNKYKKIICIGFGKPAFDAVATLQNILKDKLTCGFVISLTEGSIAGITCTVGTHPFPSSVNVQATGELIRLLSNLSEEDLVLCVVGGGGSSLLCYPYEMSCEMQISLVKQLMRKGADIYEVNTVRKHVSRVKGGQLAKICYPATVVSLIFSDVPGDDLSMVASGPTVLDATTIDDARSVLEKYNILDALAVPMTKLIETPKEDKYFKKVSNILVVSAKQALDAMCEKAKNLGYRVKIYPQSFTGEARELFLKINALSQSGTVVLGAGETVVTLRGQGKGGRNQEVVLSALEHLSEKQVLICMASDGVDNTEAAGAIGDKSSLLRAKTLGMTPSEYLDNNNSFVFFNELGDLLYTGLTGSNVSDLLILLNQ